MNDTPPVQDPQPEPMDYREARRQRRAERLADPSRSGGWIFGILLIILGGIFLLQNTGIYNLPLKNWWALFILLPALGTLESAWRAYSGAGNQLTPAAIGSLMVGMMFLLITLAFLFDISWIFFGPVLLILVGLGIIFRNLYTNN